MVAVDDGVVEIPVAAFPPTPIFKVDGALDFGNILAGGRVLKRYASCREHVARVRDQCRGFLCLLITVPRAAHDVLEASETMAHNLVPDSFARSFVFKSFRRKLTLSNVGGRDGHFEIFCPSLSSGASFGVSPAAGTVAAGEEIAIKFEILTNEQHAVRDAVKIRVVELKVREIEREYTGCRSMPALFG